MPNISSFWHAAAQLSGQIDFSQAVLCHRGHVAQLSADKLREMGIKATHMRLLRQRTLLSLDNNAITLDDEIYPDCLRVLPYAPPVLFAQGSVHLLQAPHPVAIVGARRCTDDGRRLATEIARGIAASGGIIVSGLAHGIDTAAHIAAPDKTIAVLGSGLDRIGGGPKARVAMKIIDAGGLLISEFLPNAHATKYSFPQRNRVIAGLSKGTVVVEAAMRSGARITARLALEAGREVMAVPGSPNNPTAAGCLELIAQGATMVRGIDDVRACLGLPEHQSARPAHPIVQAMGGQSLCFDELAERCQLTTTTLMRTLAMLELTGQVIRLAGDRYVEKR
jgi:DNA processing protein